MKYNRAFIIKNEKTLPFLQEAVRLDTSEDNEAKHWLLESDESFHGEHDGEYFFFKDSRISSDFYLPIDCVELEFIEEDFEEE